MADLPAWSPFTEVGSAGPAGPTGATGATGPAGPATPLPNTVVNGGLSPFTALEASGHSYMAGQGATANHGYLAKLGAILGLAPTNRGVGGAVLTSDQQAPTGNGYNTVFFTLPRAPGGGPYLPASGLYVVQWGLNDLALIGAGPAAMLMYKSALRVVLSRIRAAATGVFEETDASVTLGGGVWTALASGTGASGGTLSYITTAGTTATIAVPADFPGGTVALGYPVFQGYGGVHTVTVDGVAAGAYDTRGLAPAITGKANNNMCAVQRLSIPTPGAHTIVSTFSASAFDGFDYWQIEAPEPPLVLVVQQPRLTPTGYTAYNGSNFVPNNAMVQALNQASREVAAEFDSRVQTVDVDALIGANAAYFGTGAAVNQAHPNDAGHSLIAAACVRAVQSGPWLPALAIAS